MLNTDVMAKAAVRKHAGGGKKAKAGRPKISPLAATRKARLQAVREAAENSGLLGEKSARIGGRISPRLVKMAKKRTGIETDTDLIEFALANVALDDNFGQTFRKARASVDPTLKLGF